MSLRLRLARLEGRQDGPETDEPLFITTGVPRDDEDNGTGPTVARVGGEWISREPDEPAAGFLARVGALSPRRTP